VEFSLFRKQILALGKTDNERARKLQVPIRTLKRYKEGKLPRFIRTLSLYPHLLHALAEDAEAEQEAAKCST
jgi:hypothetical protein